MSPPVFQTFSSFAEQSEHQYGGRTVMFTIAVGRCHLVMIIYIAAVSPQNSH